MSTSGETQKSVIEAAVSRRLKTLQRDKPSQSLYMPHDEDHSCRQAFRRRIDCDILRVNKPQVAIESLQIVLKLAENILAHPDDPKYREVKITNERIKKTILAPKRVIDLVIDLGFKRQAKNWDSFLVYAAKDHHALRVGASMIKEILEREVAKYERETRRQQNEEEERKEHVKKVNTEILDDRHSVAARAQRERRTFVGRVKEDGIPRRKGTPTKGNIVTLNGRINS